MLLEAATALVLLVVWASTALLQVLRDNALVFGCDAPAHRFLVLANSARTSCWSARGLPTLWMQPSPWASWNEQNR